MMTKGEKVALVGFAAFSLLPIWRSGLRENMNLWAWIANHTIFGPPSEYIPEKYYIPEEFLTRGQTEGIYMEIR